MGDVMSLDPAATSSCHVNHQQPTTMPTNTPMPRMRPDPAAEVPREVWVVVDAEGDAVDVKLTEESAQEIVADAYDVHHSEFAPHTVTRYVTPAPALLTPAEVTDLADALELSECSGATGDDVQRLSDAVHAVIQFTTLNIQTAARWLLAAHARVMGMGGA